MVEANLVTLNNEAGLKFIPELVARKIAGAEQSVLDDADVSFHESQYQSLRAELETAFQQSALPELPDEVKYRQWGEGLEHEAVMQMEKACQLPIAVAGALMPDAHVG